MSSYTEGQIHEVAQFLEKIGATVDDLKRLSKLKDTEAFLSYLRDGGKIVSTLPWRERSGIFHLRVELESRTREEWFSYLKKKKVKITKGVEEVLQCSVLEKSKPAKVRNLGIIKGDGIPRVERTARKIVQEMKIHGVEITTFTTGYYMRTLLSDKMISKMGFKGLIIMHKPIPDPGSMGQYMMMDNNHEEKNVLGLYSDTGHPFPDNIGFVGEIK